MGLLLHSKKNEGRPAVRESVADSTNSSKDEEKEANQNGQTSAPANLPPSYQDVERIRTPRPVTPSHDLLNPYGSEENAEIQYQTCHWFHIGLLMLAETISLGVLALPQAVAHLGLVPGLLLILFLGLTATYTGYVIGQFKIAFPQVCSFADAGQLIAGPVGREVMAVSMTLILVFIMAAHILSFALMMNWLTDHATCTITFGILGMIVSFALGLPRKLQAISWLSAVSCISVIVAVTLAMACIAIIGRDTGNVAPINFETDFQKGFGSVLTMILAYAGHVAFFGFCGEMAEPRDFTKALSFMTITSCTFYMLIAAVIYYYAGPHVASPALGSATTVVARICWGIACPTIVVAGVVNGAVAAKYIYLRYWAGTDVVHRRDFKAYSSWYLINFVLWFLAWVIAEAIPNFGLLLGLISALFCSWFSYGLPGGLWLYMNKGRWTENWKKMSLTVVNVAILCLGAVICVLGMWVSGVALAGGKGGKSFSCEDNRDPFPEI